MLRKSLLFSLGLLFFSIGINFVFAVWNDPQGSPLPDLAEFNAPTVINVSTEPQVKQGGSLDLTGTLTGVKVLSTDKVGVGILTSPTAPLDVGGQVRIRGPFLPDGTPALTPGPDDGRVLTAFDPGTGATGLTRWDNLSAGISFITQGLGIDLIPDPMVGLGDTITASGTVAIDPTYTQLRVTPPCTDTSIYGAIRSVAESGVPTCQDFIPTIMAGPSSGLVLSVNGTPTTVATSGPVTLSVGVGSGLSINGSNQLALNSPGNGLQISGNQLRFANCASNGQTWKYNSGNGLWECASLPPPLTNQPGGSVMYIRSKSSNTPSTCPSGWTEAPRTAPASSPQWTTNESVGFAPPSPDTASTPAYNKVRVCYRIDRTCQVLELRTRSGGTLTCPTGVGWASVVGSEYGPLTSTANTLLNCYLCN